MSFLYLFSLALMALFSAISLASFSVSNAINLSPALGFSFKPVISTGVPGWAIVIDSPKSFFIVRTLPNVVPTTIGSPNLKVPFKINKLATPPTFLSWRDSITEPTA